MLRNKNAWPLGEARLSLQEIKRLFQKDGWSQDVLQCQEMAKKLGEVGKCISVESMDVELRKFKNQDSGADPKLKRTRDMLAINEQHEGGEGDGEGDGEPPKKRLC
jgi:hypothetical protein